MNCHQQYRKWREWYQKHRQLEKWYQKDRHQWQNWQQNHQHPNNWQQQVLFGYFHMTIELRKILCLDIDLLKRATGLSEKGMQQFEWAINNSAIRVLNISTISRPKKLKFLALILSKRRLFLELLKKRC